MQLKSKADYVFEILKKQAIEKFMLAGSIGTESIAIKPNLAPIRFDMDRGVVPLAMFGVEKKGWMDISKASSLGLIIAIFIASEGNIEDHKRFNVKPDWANIEKPDLMWFEIASRSYRRYEAYHIDRSGPEPELVLIPDDKVIIKRDIFKNVFKLHS